MSPLYGLLAVLEAMVVAWLLYRKFGLKGKPGRYEALDGLRGYLAFLVFVVHGSVWYFKIHTGIWAEPPSRLYCYWGFGSVVMFFMITGFLFTGKILNAKESGRSVDWLQLYVSRFLRLSPMYFVMLSLVIGIAILRGGDFDLFKYSGELLSWIAFTFHGDSDMFGLAHTNLVVAGATWTLPYEWTFYFVLPLIALVINRKNQGYLAILGSVAILAIIFHVWTPQVWHAECFLGGIIAAKMVRIPWLCRLAKNRWSTLLVIAPVVVSVAIEPNVFSNRALVLLAIPFVLISCGNDFFGILRKGFSKFLGEMAYSMYLLHGVVLYLAFSGKVGVAEQSLWLHWSVVYALTPVLLTLSFITFRWVEHPSMKFADSWSGSLRSILCRLRIVSPK